jgi:hypothetical protein
MSLLGSPTDFVIMDCLELILDAAVASFEQTKLNVGRTRIPNKAVSTVWCICLSGDMYDN